MKNSTSIQKVVAPSNSETNMPASQPAGNSAQIPENITGRAIFAVDISAVGIVVRTGFLSEQGNVIDMPAVFPNLSYALDQIDHLRQIVIDHFAQAAQVGVQVIAAQEQSRAGAASSADAAPYETKDATASAFASI